MNSIIKFQLSKIILSFMMTLIILVIVGCQYIGKKPDELLVLTGTIETDEIRVGSKIGGRVKQVLTREGAMVQEGDLLIRLEENELLSRREQIEAILKQTQENIRHRQARVQLLESGSREQEIQRAKAEWDAVKARLELAQKDAQRYMELYEQGAVSQQQRDNAVNQVTVYQSQYKALEESYKLLKAGFRKEEIIQAQADLNAANAALLQTMATLKEIDTQLNEMNIYAPVDSMVEICDIRPGDLIKPHQGVVSLVLLDKLWIRIYVPENYLGFMKENQPVEIKVNTYPDELFKGYIEQINRKAEFTPRNIQTPEERVNTVFGIKIRIDDTKNKLRAGMSADVRFPEIKRIGS